MTTTPLPQAKGYTDTGEVRCSCGKMVPVRVCVKDLYTPPEVQQARADLDAEVKRLREALQDVVDYDHDFCTLPSDLREIARTALENRA